MLITTLHRTHSTFQAEEQNNIMSTRIKSLKERQQDLTVAVDVVEKVANLFLSLLFSTQVENITILVYFSEGLIVS